MKLTLIKNDSYKTGVDEIVGLKPILNALMQEVSDALNDQQSWGSPGDWFQINWAEYKSRDGFIPHSDNLGGPEISQVIPSCGECDFPVCDFPEYTPSSDDLTEEEQEEERQSEEGDGLLDSHLRVWLKLESVDLETGEMSFYLVASTCDEAPYFRLKYSRDIFESEFTVKGFKQLKTVGKKHVKKLIKALKG